MAKIKKDYLVVKQNVLNEMRSTNMSLQELRLFSVYLSKINPQDLSTRVVRFALGDFLAIMELSQKNIAYFKDVAKNLIHKPIEMPTERGGFVMFNLFRVFKLDKDEFGDWYVEICADDEALPLLFDYRKNFFRYELWNALSLKSKNQLRMYEVLKQYERIGRRVIAIDELKGMLGVAKDEYPEYKIFRRDVLEVCRAALTDHTDISFTYEVGKRYGGRGGKIHSLAFTVTKNENFKDKLELDKFIDLSPYVAIDVIDPDEDDVALNPREERLLFLMDAFQCEYDMVKMAELYDLAMNALPSSIAYDDMALYNHFREKHNYVKRVASEGKIQKSEYGLLRKIIVHRT